MPEGFAISPAVRAWATSKGHTRLPERFEHFVGYCRANGKTYADWDQALMNAIRDDWAKLRGPPARASPASGKHAERARVAEEIWKPIRERQADLEQQAERDITGESQRVA